MLDLTLLESLFGFLRPSVLSWAVVLVAAMKTGLSIVSTEIPEIFRIGGEELRKAIVEVENLFSRRHLAKFWQINTRHEEIIQKMIG